jgi:hypothetical protein
MTLKLIEGEKVFPLFTFFLPIPSTIYWNEFLKKHSCVEAFSLFDGWDVKQDAEKKIFYNITGVSDQDLLDYYSSLKILQFRFGGKGK